MSLNRSLRSTGREKILRLCVKSAGVLALGVLVGNALAQQAPTPGAVQDSTRERPTLPTVPPALIEPPPAGQQADPAAPKFAVNAVQFTGNSAISSEELQAAAKPLLAPQMNLADLNRLAEAITQLYRERGYRLARAVVVAQRVENGVVRIEILEGKLGKVSFRGNQRYSSEFLAARVAPLGGGKAVTLPALERSLLLLNDLPGMSAKSVLAPGAQYGETDLDVEVEEKNFGGAFGLNNFGVKTLGTWRLDGSLDINNPFKLGDQLSARVIYSEGGQLKFGRLSYTVALGSAGTRAGFSTSATDYRVGGAFTALRLTGDSRSNELTVSHPLVRSRLTNLLLGGSVRNVVSRQYALGALLIDNELTVGSVSLLGSRISMAGAVTTAGLIFTSNGKSNDTGLRQDSLRAKLDLDVSHTMPLATNIDLYLRGQVVYSDQVLPDVERFGIGGPDSVRAFATSEIRGDRGTQGTVEGRYRFSIGGVVAVASLFVDSGQVRRLGNAAVPKESITGAGIGLNVFPGRNVRIRAEYAHRLDHHNSSDNKNSGRYWASLIYSF